MATILERESTQPTENEQPEQRTAPTALEILDAELAKDKYSRVNLYPVKERPAILNHRDLLARARRHLIERTRQEIVRKIATPSSPK